MLSKDSIAIPGEKVNKETIITSKTEVNINIFAIIFSIYNNFDLNDQLEEIQILSRYILSQKKRQIKKKKKICKKYLRK